jgi:hypothetical protein
VGRNRRRTRSQTGEPYTFSMKTRVSLLPRAVLFGLIATTALLASACGGNSGPPDKPATAPASPPAAPTSALAAGSGDAPATDDMGPYILSKINANPAIEGKATLVEFRQKSISTQPLGNKMKSAVVEFEGVVTFSSDVSWSWQGPTKAGEPQKFEARAEYVDKGNGWQLVEPLGIYPL